jgi:predicted AlkP superfamily phosphohydrolase/phosphomutase
MPTSPLARLPFRRPVFPYPRGPIRRAGAATGSRPGAGLVVAALLFLVGSLLLGGCGGEPEPPPGVGRLLVIGIDSADWRLLEPMIGEGRLPVLAAFREQATWGRMHSFVPLDKSPILWASLTTGVRPEVHGVGGFGPERQDAEQITGSAWGAPAIWDIAGAAGRRSAVIGMWATYPARDIAGVMVSDYLTYGRERENPLQGLVTPDSLTAEIVALRVDPEAVERTLLERLVDPELLVMAEEKYAVEVGHLRDILAADLTYTRVAEHLAARGDYDLFYYYLRGPDRISHKFYSYLKPADSRMRLSDEAIAIFGQVVPRYYEWVDELMAEVLGWFPPDQPVVVLSDHGFYGPRMSGLKGTAEHSEWGIFLVRSALYMPAYKFPSLELLDVAPTMLALLGLPPGGDMPGVVLTEGLTPAGERWVRGLEERRLASYLALRPDTTAVGEQDAAVDAEIEKQLRSLGYID